MERKEITEILFKLTKQNGVSGDEFCASQTAAEMLKKYTDDVTVDDFGNVIANIGKREKGKPHVMLDAHIDEIGFIVTYITDDGFLKISNCGGIDRRLLLAQQVEVLCSDGKSVFGVITSTPPHLETDDKKVSKLSDVFVDIGMSKEIAQESVSLGDRVIISNNPAVLSRDRVTSKCLDDRAGVVTLICAVDMLKNEFDDLDCSLSVVFSSQEETGERGAKTAAYKVNPDIAIAVDVSFARVKGDKIDNCGEMGKGPMIGVSSSLSKHLSDKIINIAKDKAIPYQIEVMGGTTGTNADAIGVTRSGVKTVTVSIPLKYMHTPVEVISISDIESSAELIAEYIRSGVKSDV